MSAAIATPDPIRTLKATSTRLAHALQVACEVHKDKAALLDQPGARSRTMTFHNHKNLLPQ
jgi:hypothetical protein